MKMNLGAPEIPKAQLVFTGDRGGGLGVAVQGGKYVCKLPKGYRGEGLELAITENGQLLAIHPEHAPLVIDPSDGSVRPL